MAQKKKSAAKKAFQEADGSRQLTLQCSPRFADTISEKYISAGWLLSQMDLAGGRRAHDYTGGRTVTVGIDAMSFHKPVFVGDTVGFHTEVVRQGRTSLTLRIESWAHRRGGNKKEKVTEGLFTFVQVDEGQKPTEIKKTLKNDAATSFSLSPPKPLPPGTKKKELSIRNIPLPRDVNYLGDVFGGWILEQMDLACAKAAEKYTGRRAVTVGLEAMTFHKPVLVDDHVSFYTEIVRTGRTSVGVRVETWADRPGGAQEKVTEGLFTYVSIDNRRQPVRLDLKKG